MSKFAKLPLFLALIFALSACSSDNKPNSASNTQPPPAFVSVQKVKKENIPISFKFSTKVVSNQDIKIKAKVVGAIEKQFFTPGDSVKKGDKLYLIDQTRYRANYESALANLRVASANFNNISLEYNRTTTLYAKQAISKKEFDASKAAYEVASANMSFAKAQVSSAKLELDYSLVVAPFDGVLGDSLKDVGAYVSQNDDLVRITNLDQVYAKFSIPDTQFLSINSSTKLGAWEQVNQNATLLLGKNEYKGKIDFIGKVIDANTASVDARAKFDNPKHEILPGNFGHIVVDGFVQKNGVKVPYFAIQQDLATSFVYVVEDDKVAKRPIEISFNTKEFAVISVGLDEGDEIILDNFLKIGVGSKVSVINREK